MPWPNEPASQKRYILMNVMSGATKQILEAALRLPPEEREQLVEELTASLPSDFSGKEIEKAWLGEIDRRSNEIDADTAEILEWSDVREQIAQRRARRSG
jgi:putative addiction module component (TIGR02574 family)